ncbi:unnamed protein product [Lampetra planeri]
MGSELPEKGWQIDEPAVATPGTELEAKHLPPKEEDGVKANLWRSVICILQYVECFAGPDITAIHSMLINKSPDTG